MRRPPKTALCPQIKTGLKSSRASLVASPSLGTNAARGRWGLGTFSFLPPAAEDFLGLRFLSLSLVSLCPLFCSLNCT